MCSQSFSSSYLNSIRQTFNSRIDGNTDGKKDGKITVAEAYRDLNISDMLSGLNPSSQEYNRIKSATDRVPQALRNYAGSDGVFTENEWANFLNGAEWGAALDAYHSTSRWAEHEMSSIDEASDRNGRVSVGEVKAGLLNSISETYSSFNTTELEAIVDNYAGNDGIFSKEEYTRMLNDPKYRNIINQTGATPYYSKNNTNNNFGFNSMNTNMYGNMNGNMNITAQWAVVGNMLNELFSGIIDKMKN